MKHNSQAHSLPTKTPDVKKMHAARKAISVKIPREFRLPPTVKSHGWYDLPPFEWDEQGVLARVLEVGGRAIDTRIRTRPGRLEVAVAPAAPEAEVRAQVTRMLSLDEDLEALYAFTDAHPPAAWARAAGA